jgi:hypothetical protein
VTSDEREKEIASVLTRRRARDRACLRSPGSHLVVVVAIVSARAQTSPIPTEIDFVLTKQASFVYTCARARRHDRQTSAPADTADLHNSERPESLPNTPPATTIAPPAGLHESACARWWRRFDNPEDFPLRFPLRVPPQLTGSGQGEPVTLRQTAEFLYGAQSGGETSKLSLERQQMLWRISRLPRIEGEHLRTLPTLPPETSPPDAAAFDEFRKRLISEFGRDWIMASVASIGKMYRLSCIKPNDTRITVADITNALCEAIHQVREGGGDERRVTSGLVG